MPPTEHAETGWKLRNNSGHFCANTTVDEIWILRRERFTPLEFPECFLDRRAVVVVGRAIFDSFLSAVKKRRRFHPRANRREPH